jgi:hypothetical protein
MALEMSKRPGRCYRRRNQIVDVCRAFSNDIADIEIEELLIRCALRSINRERTKFVVGMRLGDTLDKMEELGEISLT